MEGEEDTSVKQQFAMLYQKLNKIKRDLHEDDTDNINRIIGSNSPAVCLSYLMDLEKKGDPRQDPNHLNKLVDFYTRVFANMPVGKHCQTESYARMLVRFAELKANQDVNEAEANFNKAKSHCQDFAFVHIAHAQFEYSQGHTKRSISILQEALKLGARPTELLEAALQNLQPGRGHPQFSEDKENIPALPHKNELDSGKNIGSEYRKVFQSSDGTCDLQLSSISCPGTDQRTGPLEDQHPGRQSALQRQRAVGMPGRVPIVQPVMPVKRSDAFIPSLSRQTPGSSTFTLSSAMKNAGHGDPGPGDFRKNTGHGDSGPEDFRKNTGHGDSGHGDFRKNTGHGDSGPGDFRKNAGHGDPGHGDYRKNTGHGDSGPGDFRKNTGHGDSGHGDFRKNAGHGDPGPGDYKKNAGHGDPGHGDFRTNTGHGDSGHGDFRKNAGDGDFNLKPPSISPEPRPWEELSMVDSTTTLMNRRDTSRMEDTTYNFEQVLSSSCPEACRAYLLNMERRGDPHTDPSLLAKLNHCYFQVFTRMPLASFSRNESHARMLVRLAELKGIEDADDARDHFIMARSNSKLFAFVHIAYAQFEVSQGNVQKAASILQKAQSLNARPAELLENAMRNLRAGRSQLLPPDQPDTPTPEPQAQGAFVSAVGAAEREQEAPSRACVSQGPQGQPKPPSREPLSGWKMPSCLSQLVSPEEKQTRGAEPIPRLLDSLSTPTLHSSPPEPVPPRPLGSLSTPSLQTTPPEPVDSVPLPSKFNPPAVCQTPSYKDPAANSFVTPVVKRIPPAAAPPSAPRRDGPAQLPCTPVNQGSFQGTQQPPQGPGSALSRGSITIKGRQFFILKMIGRGGSSKVYQVLDHKNQLFAVKVVKLEEADAQTVESYQNEIEHLNRLQQYSEQIIKLYDYEISSSHIYMLMECGNLDLSSWLRTKKTVNPLERKFYWKNMLEAVSTIHKHGIVHSDLKPANFVIVNASLKLIDFGIANRIQPDVTSIMKDTQVGTLNYMPPEAIKDTSSKPGKASSKISPKGDVWSMGCILYSMTYGKTPFQSITNQFSKLHAIIDPSHHIDFPDIPEKDLLDVLKRCLVRNPRERISIAELLEHSYLQLQHQPTSEPDPTENREVRRFLSDLALQSPGSIVRAVTNLGKMYSSDRRLDAAERVKPSSQPSWKM